MILLVKLAKKTRSRNHKEATSGCGDSTGYLFQLIDIQLRLFLKVKKWTRISVFP